MFNHEHQPLLQFVPLQRPKGWRVGAKMLAEQKAFQINGRICCAMAPRSAGLDWPHKPLKMH